jgi:peptidoglycan/xylan/chitin deacetylase (PgdA/CDA1 family)
VTSRTVVLTFDNLGEAAELERGAPPRGDHPSVTAVLPRLLAVLDELELRVTFFVEGINTELYPDAVREIARRGHEIGCHGWRHERWDRLGPDEEGGVLARCSQAFGSLGIRLRGFRPPGGNLSAAGWRPLAALGFDWCSPAGTRAEAGEDMVVLPFRWELVDATYLLGHFDGLRRELGLPSEALAPEDFERRLWAELAAWPAHEPAVIILHPFIALDEAAWAMHRRVLGRLAELRVLPGGELADELRAR